MVTLIKTVGDLVKALSVYPADAPLVFTCDREILKIGTDMSIFAVIPPNQDETKHIEITLSK